MKYLTPAEFADQVPLPGVDNKELWVKRRCRAREITHTRVSRNIILIPAVEVERWLAEHTVEHLATQPETVPLQDDSPEGNAVVDIAAAVRSRRRVGKAS